MTSDPAVTMKTRLRSDLRDAMRARADTETRTLRSLIAALDNAEAPPASGAVGEVQRLLLSEAEVQTVVEREAEQHEDAAREFDRLGVADRADDLRKAATIARRYLD